MGFPVSLNPIGAPCVFSMNGVPATVTNNGMGAPFRLTERGPPLRLEDEAGRTIPDARFLVETYSPGNGVAMSFANNTLYIADPVTPANNYNGPLVDTVSGLFNKLTFSRASTGTYRDGAGVIRTAGNNVPRVSYESEGRTLLMEGARTNAVLGSANDISNASWLKTTGVSVVSTNRPDPAGTTTASRISYDGSGGAGGFRFYQTTNIGVVANGIPASSSIFVKSNGGNALLRLYDNLGGAGEIFTATSEWKRVSYVGSGNGVSAHQLLIYSQAGNNAAFDIDVWCAQAEAAAWPSSPIPTAGATRAADVCTLASSLFNLNQATGTLYARNTWDGGTVVSQGVRAALSIDDGTTAEAHTINNGGGLGQAFTIDGGANQSTQFDLAIANAVLSEHAWAYAVNDFAFVQNARTPKTGATGTLPTTTTMGIGCAAGSNQLFGKIFETAFFGSRLSNASMQALTNI